MYPSWENEEILYSSNYCQGTRFKVESKVRKKIEWKMSMFN